MSSLSIQDQQKLKNLFCMKVQKYDSFGEVYMRMYPDRPLLNVWDLLDKDLCKKIFDNVSSDILYIKYGIYGLADTANTIDYTKRFNEFLNKFCGSENDHDVVSWNRHSKCS